MTGIGFRLLTMGLDHNSDFSCMGWTFQFYFLQLFQSLWHQLCVALVGVSRVSIRCPTVQPLNLNTMMIKPTFIFRWNENNKELKIEEVDEDGKEEVSEDDEDNKTYREHYVNKEPCIIPQTWCKNECSITIEFSRPYISKTIGLT